MLSNVEQTPVHVKLVGVILILFAAAATYVFYQLFLHPLARYPGPTLAKLTDFWGLYHAYHSNRNKAIHKLHQKHGPIVRFGPNKLSFDDPQAAEQIYGAKANTRKADYYATGFGVSIFSCVDKDVHAKKRRIMSHAFSEQALRDMQPYMVPMIKIWLKALTGEKQHIPARSNDEKQGGHGGWSLPRDMAQWSSYLSVDVLTEIAFGKSLGASTNPAMRGYHKVVTLSARVMDLSGQIPWLGRRGLGLWLERGAIANREKQVEFSTSQLDARMAMGPNNNDRKDIIQHLIEGRDPKTGEGYGKAELISEVNILFAGGTDTTATALSATIFYLLHNPRTLAKLYKEIRSAFADVEAIVKGPELDSLTYLDACVEETLRIAMPAPTHFAREVLAGGQEIMGHHFPAGTVVGISFHSLHHNRKYFDDAEQYRPERWLLRDDNNPEVVDAATLDRHRQSYMPFSIGPRACIGRKVALIELHIAIARLLFQYDIRLSPGFEQVGVAPDGGYLMKENFNVVGKEGPVVELRAVNSQI